MWWPLSSLMQPREAADIHVRGSRISVPQDTTSIMCIPRLREAQYGPALFIPNPNARESQRGAVGISLLVRVRSGGGWFGNHLP